MYKPQFWAHGNNTIYKLLSLLFVGLFLHLFIQQTCVGLPLHPDTMPSDEFMRLTLRRRVWAEVNMHHFWVKDCDCWYKIPQSSPPMLGWPREPPFPVAELQHRRDCQPVCLSTALTNPYCTWSMSEKLGCVNHGILRLRMIYYCSIT